jgi:elongation factor 1-gamma
MSIKLYTDLGNFRAFKVLIAAEYNNVSIEIPDFKLGQDNKSAEFLAKSPLGRVPVLETESGSIFESNAIARYVARMNASTELMGKSFFNSAQVDMWIDFCNHDIELPATIWYYPVLGHLPYNAGATEKAKADLSNALKVLESHLMSNTFLVGDKITLADITVVSALVYPFKFVCDGKFRSAFPNVVRWFTTCANQQQFINIIGTVELAKKELTAGGKIIATGAPATGKPPWSATNPKPKEPKAPKAPKAPKVEKPKEEKKPKVEDEEEAAPKKKEEHPFKIMDREAPSAFVMDTWKKCYSNTEDYRVAMKTFFEYDLTGWSIHRGDYNYNEENKILFMSSNLIGGFIQRTEEIRKWLFGTMTIRGVEKTESSPADMKITSYYLIRGDSIAPLLSCNDDAQCYTWTKVDMPASEKDKEQLYDYWCSEGPLDGEACLDSRCYK